QMAKAVAARPPSRSAFRSPPAEQLSTRAARTTRSALSGPPSSDRVDDLEGAGGQLALRLERQPRIRAHRGRKLLAATDQHRDDDQREQVESAELTERLDCLRATDEVHVSATVRSAHLPEQLGRIVFHYHLGGRPFRPTRAEDEDIQVGPRPGLRPQRGL